MQRGTGEKEASYVKSFQENPVECGEQSKVPKLIHVQIKTLTNYTIVR